MARRRDHRVEQRRRNDLARARGFRSRAQERKFNRHIANRGDLERLPKAARDQRAKALQVISHLRENPTISLDEAARLAGTTPEAVTWHGGEALQRKGGRWRARAGDRIYRPMIVHSEGRTVAVDVRGSRKASEVSVYHRAVAHFLQTGDETVLRRFRGKSVAGHPYETDPGVLEEMARRGQLDVESIYQLVT